jgi:hypothetical protein
VRFSPRDPLRSWVLRALCWGETEHFNSHSAVIEDHRDDPFHRKGASKRLLFDGAVIIFLTTNTLLLWAPQLTQPNFASLAEKSGRMQIVSLPTTLASRPFLPRCTFTHSPRRTLLRSFPPSWRAPRPQVSIIYSHYCEFARFALLVGNIPFDEVAALPAEHTLRENSPLLLPLQMAWSHHS